MLWVVKTQVFSKTYSIYRERPGVAAEYKSGGLMQDDLAAETNSIAALLMGYFDTSKAWKLVGDG